MIRWEGAFEDEP